MRLHLLPCATAVAILVGAGGPGAALAQGCPVEGTAHSESGRALNILKNRATAPQPDQIDRSATLSAILAPGDDATRWLDAKGAQIIGYVIDVKRGGVETVNCGAHDVAHRDTHIEIALTPDAPETARMIVEVTPTWRQKMAAEGIDLSTPKLEQALKEQRVVVRGWLMFDKYHADESENTAPGRANDWRATAWEIHPITDIEILTTEPLRLPPDH